MFKIRTLNPISRMGLEQLPEEYYEVSDSFRDPDAILVRSYKMLDMELSPTLKIIARAGAGTNNIPIDRCTDRGIVVCNTPGANANSVKELVLAALFFSSRKIIEGVTWVNSLKKEMGEITKLVEKEKSRFAGPEIKGKTLGVIGLGAIGVMVANDALALGMRVIGYDPFISIESAWGLSRNVIRAKSLDGLLGESDYLTLHVPLDDATEGMISSKRFKAMKRGVRILNFSRGGVVRNKDLAAALKDGTVASYITDFPDPETLSMEHTLAIPHLGASTPEAEDNCAVMAACQTREFLEWGNIKNSVNFPDCEMQFSGNRRILISNRNIPGVVGQITNIMAQEKINIADMLNRSREHAAYNIIDIDGDISHESISRIQAIEGVTGVRVLYLQE
ncbi:MAG: phosphoglycerate dehydrogenase [Spirochaetes bacterium]|nr:phosphoglycerate dehydrogenase [Spirochaetota bacterium]